jgi:hypothetical protein
VALRATLLKWEGELSGIGAAATGRAAREGWPCLWESLDDACLGKGA